MRLTLILIHVLVCVALRLIILFQRGKGADMGAAFGGSSQAVFGSTGATSFLHKMTVAAAVIFMLTSLILAFLSGRGATSSVMKGVKPPQAQTSQVPQSAPPAGGSEKK